MAPSQRDTVLLIPTSNQPLLCGTPPRNGKLFQAGKILMLVSVGVVLLVAGVQTLNPKSVSLAAISQSIHTVQPMHTSTSVARNQRMAPSAYPIRPGHDFVAYASNVPVYGDAALGQKQAQVGATPNYHEPETEWAPIPNEMDATQSSSSSLATVGVLLGVIVSGVVWLVQTHRRHAHYVPVADGQPRMALMAMDTEVVVDAGQAIANAAMETAKAMAVVDAAHAVDPAQVGAHVGAVVDTIPPELFSLAEELADPDKWPGGFDGLVRLTEESIKLVHRILEYGGLENNYGVSIILFTLLIKGLTFPLTKKSTESTTRAQKLQPRVEEIKERFKNDKDQMNIAISRLYKEANINPLAGIFPAFAQIPIFIALYRALLNLASSNSIDEPFLWFPSLEGPVYGERSADWLVDFSKWVDGAPPLGWHDTLAFLTMPVILISLQVASQKAMKVPGQETPEWTKYLPYVFGAVAINVPAGLGVYWVVNSAFTTAATLSIRKGIQEETDAEEAANPTTVIPGTSTVISKEKLEQKERGQKFRELKKKEKRNRKDRYKDQPSARGKKRGKKPPVTTAAQSAAAAAAAAAGEQLQASDDSDDEDEVSDDESDDGDKGGNDGDKGGDAGSSTLDKAGAAFAAPTPKAKESAPSAFTDDLKQFDPSNLKKHLGLADDAPPPKWLQDAGLAFGAVALSLLGTFGGPVPEAMAQKLSVPMENVNYEEISCGDSGTQGGKTKVTQSGYACVRFTGDVTNKSKDAINTADIYGRIYDAAQNDVTDNSENDRIAYVDRVPPGTSKVSFDLSLPKSQLELGKLRFKTIKVSGFTGKVLPGQAGLLGLPNQLNCDAIVNDPDADPLDLDSCEEQANELAIR